MANKRESGEVELLLSLPMEDWEWLLGHLAKQYYARSTITSDDKSREAWLVGLLYGQLRLQRAALQSGTATDAATMRIEEMKILDPPEPIAGDRP